MPKRHGDEDEAEGGTLTTDPEIEAALREAEAAIDAAEAGSGEHRIPKIDPSESHPEADFGSVDPTGAARKSTDEEVEDLAAELIEAKDQLVRLQADFDNFRKRALKERQEAVQYGHQNLVKDLLSAVDNLERAVDHARKNGGGELESFLQGVELVQRELITALGNHDVVKVEAHGKPFDPSVHEAMAQAPDATVPPNTVIDVFQQGYLLRDRLIRPARVVVAKAPDDSTSEGGGAGG